GNRLVNQLIADKAAGGAGHCDDEHNCQESFAGIHCSPPMAPTPPIMPTSFRLSLRRPPGASSSLSLKLKVYWFGSRGSIFVLNSNSSPLRVPRVPPVGPLDAFGPGV